MKIKGEKREVCWSWEKRRTLKIQKSNCLQENLDPFIASIYM